MLSTGKLTELKSIPDDLLENLLVSRAATTPMKQNNQSSLESGTAMLLDKAQLQGGSLCLVGVPFGVPISQLWSQNGSTMISIATDENGHPNNTGVNVNQDMISIDMNVPILGHKPETSKKQPNQQLPLTTTMMMMMRINNSRDDEMQYLTLSPGDTVELLGPFPIDQAQDWSQIYFYGRQVLEKVCHSKINEREQAV